jgi:hypothetical protein
MVRCCRFRSARTAGQVLPFSISVYSLPSRRQRRAQPQPPSCCGHRLPLPPGCRELRLEPPVAGGPPHSHRSTGRLEAVAAQIPIRLLAGSDRQLGLLALPRRWQSARHWIHDTEQRRAPSIQMARLP